MRNLHIKSAAVAAVVLGSHPIAYDGPGADYTTTLGARQLEEEIASEMRIRSGLRQKSFDGLYNMVGGFKAKRKAMVNIGSARMTKQTNAKGKIERTHITANKNYIETCWFNLLICFSYDEMKNGEADVVGPTIKRMQEASNAMNDAQALEALFGEIIMGDPCKLEAYRDICHIAHDGVGLTPEKVIKVQDEIGTWFPGTEMCVGITQQSMSEMKRHPEWTNNDLLVGPSAFNGMIETWGNVKFKLVPDYRNEEDLIKDPMGTLEPIIPAVPYVVNGVWDGESFIRVLPVWIKSALNHASIMSPQIDVDPEYYKKAQLAYGVASVRIDENLGFAINDERGRAAICVVEKSKALAESYIKSGGVGFGLPVSDWNSGV